MTKFALNTRLYNINQLIISPNETADIPRVFTPFEKTVFYDGYNGTVFDKDVQDGILRHANYLYAKKLTDEALNWFGSRMDIDVTINALCDT